MSQKIRELASNEGGMGFVCSCLSATLLWCGFLERVVLALLRPIRTAPLARGVWWRLRAELCRQTAGRDSGLRWIRLPSGAWLRVHLAELLGGMYLDGEGYEQKTTTFILENLKPGDVMADIGANYGYFSMLAGPRIGPEGRVYAFEANPELQVRLKESIARNRFEGRVISTDVALSDEDRDGVDFYLSLDPAQAGISTMHPWEEHLKKGNLSGNNKIRVRTRSFDSWAIEAGLDRLDVIKLDVEGSELEVLQGMRKSLDRFRPRFVVCETSLDGKVSAFLESCGYQAAPIEYHVPDAKWGNILYTRRDATKG